MVWVLVRKQLTNFASLNFNLIVNVHVIVRKIAFFEQRLQKTDI